MTRGTTTEYSVGDHVRSTRDIWDHADDYGPAGMLASKGDDLIVRTGNVPPNANTWAVHVAHEDVKDRSFGVNTDEIEKVVLNNTQDSD